MIILSFNCRGLANPSKKLAIKRLVDLHQPSVLLLQETMMEGEKTMLTLSFSLLGWDFSATDVIGHSRGLITRMAQKFSQSCEFVSIKVDPGGGLLLLRTRFGVASFEYLWALFWRLKNILGKHSLSLSLLKLVFL
jgi:hypothetical protein